MLESDEECECTMTEEEIRIYEDQVSKSGGFDVSPVSGDPGYRCIIQPWNNTNSALQDFELYSQLAVNEYNRRFKEENRVLEFVKVLKAMGRRANLFVFYITFEAKDVGDGGKIKIYQAVIFYGVPDIEVASFRLKPDDHEQGSDNHGKEWLWEHEHLFREKEARMISIN
ncbi:uncharacterized protein LOC132172944 [Corylus avellana]|uniref:uncharacterized protein LOC132172944 n=1 Tax=Corylus avellana TaxID=13451 RepID=UPI001E217FCA|nr:uncharacterized protein LOC132172944 [Corylus avellana]